MAATFSDLIPNHLLLQIFHYLPCKDLLIANLVSKEWAQLTCHYLLWQNLCQSRVSNKVKLDLVLHGNILHGNLYERWKQFYKKLHKAMIVSNSQELNSLNFSIGMTVYLLPGEYNIEFNTCPPIQMIGLGSNSKQVILTGGSWGVLSFEGLDVYNTMYSGLLRNVTIKSDPKNATCHALCVGKGAVMKICDCYLDATNIKATCLNIYGKNTDVVVQNNVIANSPKHSIYVGQGAKALIKNNELLKASHSGVHVVSYGRAIITKNKISFCNHHGVFVNTNGYANVQNNEISSIRGHAVSLSPGALSDCIVKDNVERDIKKEEVEGTTSTDDCIVM